MYIIICICKSYLWPLQHIKQNLSIFLYSTWFFFLILMRETALLCKYLCMIGAVDLQRGRVVPMSYKINPSPTPKQTLFIFPNQWESSWRKIRQKTKKGAKRKKALPLMRSSAVCNLSNLLTYMHVFALLLWDSIRTQDIKNKNENA